MAGNASRYVSPIILHRITVIVLMMNFSECGPAKKDSNVSLQTRLSTTDQVARKRARNSFDAAKIARF